MEEYTLYILAGGKSSRMGVDKGLIKLHGKEMVAHCIDTFKPLAKEIVLITSNPAYEKFGHRLLTDEQEHQGPAMGILTALNDLQSPKCIILSCDMPLINDSLIQPLDKAFIETEIACYKKEELLFPFPGIYSKSILEEWNKKFSLGNRALQKLIPQFNYKTLPIEHPDLFLNVNTPEDLKLVEEKLR